MGRRHHKRIRIIACGAVLTVLLSVGCVRQDAWLSYAVPETQQPTATAVITPVPTRDKDTHYYTYYLAFSDMRIYEENGYTYMDGICTNTFDGTLTGEARLCFYDADEKLVGYGVIHTAEGNLTLGVGANRIYAEILSEVDVQQLTCRIEQTAPFNPA